MAQFKVFDPDSRVSGRYIATTYKGLPDYTDLLKAILARQGLSDLQDEAFYPWQAWLDAFSVIHEQYGPNTIYMIGRALPKQLDYGKPDARLKDLLEGFNDVFLRHHQGEDLGSYELTDFDRRKHTATMKCRNPYPCHFDRGIITTLVREHKPEDSVLISVDLDLELPNRLVGADSSVYHIKW